jgi:two-component system OmpR family response regulator
VHTCSVLVVDDDPMILQLVADVLREAEYPVETAQSALEAARAIAHAPASIVILDIRMPGLDGTRFARDLRQRHIDAKILVMTGGANARGLAEEIAAEGYITKPFEISDLLKAVERLCGDGSAAPA